MLIRTKQSDKEPEVPRSLASSARQAYMGAKVTKRGGVSAPVEEIIKQHPDRKNQIQLCMKKWHERTSGRLWWPREGTFDEACCGEVEANIEHYKAKDTSNKREGKKSREREVVGRFRQEGRRRTQARTMQAETQTKDKEMQEKDIKNEKVKEQEQ